MVDNKWIYHLKKFLSRIFRNKNKFKKMNIMMKKDKEVKLINKMRLKINSILLWMKKTLISNNLLVNLLLIKILNLVTFRVHKQMINMKMKIS